MNDIYYYKIKPLKLSNGQIADEYIRDFLDAHNDYLINEMSYYMMFDIPHTSTDKFPILSANKRLVCGSFNGKLIRIGRISEYSKKPYPITKKLSAQEKYQKLKKIDAQIKDLKEQREKIKGNLNV